MCTHTLRYNGTEHTLTLNGDKGAAAAVRYFVESRLGYGLYPDRIDENTWQVRRMSDNGREGWLEYIDDQD